VDELEPGLAPDDEVADAVPQFVRGGRQRRGEGQPVGGEAGVRDPGQQRAQVGQEAAGLRRRRKPERDLGQAVHA
jgi:hypothetical protein